MLESFLKRVRTWLVGFASHARNNQGRILSALRDACRPPVQPRPGPATRDFDCTKCSCLNFAGMHTVLSRLLVKAVATPVPSHRLHQPWQPTTWRTSLPRCALCVALRTWQTQGRHWVQEQLYKLAWLN